jgi:hypothetical protein
VWTHQQEVTSADEVAFLEQGMDWRSRVAALGKRKSSALLLCADPQVALWRKSFQERVASCFYAAAAAPVSLLLVISSCILVLLFRY